MKNKGITIWEQHVEKLVLLLAILAAGYFVSTQFIGNPNAATIGGKQVAPGEVDAILEAKAREISQKLSDDAPPTLEFPEVKPVVDVMVASLEDSVSPVNEIMIPSYDTVPRGGVIGLGPKAYHVPQLLAAAPTFAKQYHDALTQEAVSAHNLGDRFETGQPLDITFVSFFGKIDVKQVREQLELFDAEHAQIPSVWYSGKPLWVDLVIEREEQMGENVWGNRTVLPPLPGQYSFRSQLSAKMSIDQRNRVVDELLKPEVQSAIIQPEFLPTRRGSWQPMSVSDLETAMTEPTNVASDADNEVATLDRVIRRLSQERDRVSKALDELGGPLIDEETEPAGRPGGTKPPRGSGGGNAPPGAGPGKGGGGMSNTKGTDAAADARSKERRLQLSKRLRQLENQIAAKQQEREKLAGALVVETVEDDGPADQIMVWGHDIDVEPGKVYRYRMTLRLINPFFARRLNLVPEQQQLADQIALDTPPSEWSEPISVDPSVRIFLTSARPASDGRDVIGGGFGSATFQVFRFYDGLTWQEEFVVEPGERIGDRRRISIQSGSPDTPGRSEDIDFRTQWMVVDIIPDAEPVPSGRLTQGQGLQAKVVLLDLQTGKTLELRDPRSDRFSLVRQELLEEVELSELAALNTP